MSDRYGAVAKGFALSLATLLVLLGILGAGEIYLRHVTPANDGALRRLEALKWSSGPCYLERNIHGVPSLVENPPATMPELVNRLHSPRHFPLARTPGVRRIAVVGESSANMLENQLDFMLEHNGCSDPVELLLCSVPGSDLLQTSRRFDEVMRYAPDDVVLVFGHNAFRAEPSDAMAIEAQLLRERFRLLAWLVNATQLQNRARPSAGEAMTALSNAFHRFGTEARQHGVSLIVTTMASNLRFAPVPDDPASAHGAAPPPLQSEGRLEAQFQHELHHDAVAIEQLREAARREDGAEVRFLLGSWLYQAGDYAGALEQFVRARDLDPGGSRATTEINQRIHSAVADTGAVLRDTEANVLAGAPHGIPGFETFLDNCHLQAGPLHAEVMAILKLCSANCHDPDKEFASMFAALRPLAGSWLAAGSVVNADHKRKEGADISDSNAPLSRAVIDGFSGIVRQASNSHGSYATTWMENIGVFVDGWLEIDGATVAPLVVQMLDAPPFSSLPLEMKARAVVRVAEAFYRSGRVQEAVSLNARARQIDSRSDEAWLQSGLFRLRQNDTRGAIADFDRTVAISPTRTDAAFFAHRLRVP